VFSINGAGGATSEEQAQQQQRSSTTNFSELNIQLLKNSK
jgi:hypothetical protein